MKKTVILASIILSSVAFANMQITEWMYSGGGGEFVEFTNVGSEPVDMTGWSFDDDHRIAGTFDLSGFGVVAPGESVILTEDPAETFRADWNLAAGVKIVGELGNTTGNKLGREDEINLYDENDNLIDSLTYSDKEDWGPRTKDKSCSVPSWGYSETVAKSTWVLSEVGDQYDSWQSSNDDVGSPGFVPQSEVPVGGLIINEFNAVGSEKYLDAAQYADANDVDTYLQALADGKYPDKITGTLPNGRIQGNGSDWIEFVVTVDNLDIRNWEIRWAELGANEANGTDIWYGDGNVEQGVLKFSDNSIWSNMQAGTIITIVEEDTIYVDTTNENRTYNVAPGSADAVIDMSTDTSFDPVNNDWWINVSVRDESYQSQPLVISTHNVLNHSDWDFGVGNDDWEAGVYDAAGNLIWGHVGEDLDSEHWGGGGLSSTEVARLEQDPSAASTGAGFDDANSSSFGMPNRWGETVQNYISLRGAYKPFDCYEAIALGYGNPYDFNGDCYVDLQDYANFANNWLDCVNPEDENCSTPWF